MLETWRSNPYEFKVVGQVGQQAHLQPAVLEFASLRPLVFVHVHHI
jgi:hypothetical protein